MAPTLHRSAESFQGGHVGLGDSEIDCCQVLLHVGPVGGPGERHHADGKGEAEHHLRDGGAQPAGDRRHGRSAQLALVGGQQGEPLVDDAALATDLDGPPGPTRSGRSSGSAPTPARPWPIRTASPADHGRCCSLPGAAPAVPGAAAPSRSTPPGRPRSSRAEWRWGNTPRIASLTRSGSSRGMWWPLPWAMITRPFLKRETNSR